MAPSQKMMKIDFRQIKVQTSLWFQIKHRKRAILALSALLLSPPIHAQTLPPPEDIPEEILQTEIIMDARSPIDGEPLTAAEYAELQAQLRIAAEDVPGRVTPRLQTLISLLRIRKLLRPLLPFLIK